MGPAVRRRVHHGLPDAIRDRAESECVDGPFRGRRHGPRQQHQRAAVVSPRLLQPLRLGQCADADGEEREPAEHRPDLPEPAPVRRADGHVHCGDGVRAPRPLIHLRVHRSADSAAVAVEFLAGVLDADQGGYLAAGNRHRGVAAAGAQRAGSARVLQHGLHVAVHVPVW